MGVDQFLRGVEKVQFDLDVRVEEVTPTHKGTSSTNTYSLPSNNQVGVVDLGTDRKS